MLVSDIIETAVDTVPNSVYLRATDLETNTSVADIELAGKTFCVFNNLPTITTNLQGGQLSTYPIEIQLLELANQDDNTVQSDDIRERLIPIAQKVFNTVASDSRVSLIEFASSYDMTLEGNVKLYDTVMTGLTITFDIYIDNLNTCSGN